WLSGLLTRMMASSAAAPRTMPPAASRRKNSRMRAYESGANCVMAGTIPYEPRGAIRFWRGAGRILRLDARGNDGYTEPKAFFGEECSAGGHMLVEGSPRLSNRNPLLENGVLGPLTI